MRKSIDQDTLQALIETGAAREFRVTRGPGGEGGRWPPSLYSCSSYSIRSATACTRPIGTA